MHILVVYYSLTGHTRTVATHLATLLGADLSEIRDVRPRRGIWGRVRSVAEAILGLEPSIDYQGPDPSRYDAVVLGGPVWALSVAPPLLTFLHGHIQPTVRLALFCTAGGAGGRKALERFAFECPQPVAALCDLRRADVTSGASTDRVRDFARSIRLPLREAAGARVSMTS